MTNVLLICTAGMSTSALVVKMQKAAEEMGIEAKIWAVGDTVKKEEVPKADVIMLGPQVRFLKPQIEKIAAGKPVIVIDMRQYGAMNGKAVLESALDALK